MSEPKSINAKIEAMFKIREKVRKLEADIKLLNEEKDAISAALMEQMDKEGVTKSAGKNASVTISEAVVPSVENWDEFYKYIHRKKFYHLLERRPSVSGCRELFDKSGRIPGVVPFTKRTIQLRVAK